MAKAELRPEVGDPIPCLFNPADFTLTKSNAWDAPEPKGKNAKQLTFQQGQSGTLTMSLVLDTTNDGSPVTRHTDALLSLMVVDDRLKSTDKGRNKGRPPWVRFHWGDFHSFRAVVERVQLKFTYFAADGTPLRANADLALKQYDDEGGWGPQNPTSMTPHPERVHRVQPGETIDRIAAAELGDPTRWRLIAAANSITDPFGLRPGDFIVIPEASVTRRG